MVALKTQGWDLYFVTLLIGFSTLPDKSPYRNKLSSELHTGSYTVINVAYNPGVLQAAEKDPGIKDQLIKMAMHCIEERFQFTLTHSYHVTSFKIKGSIPRMKENLMGTKTDFTGFKGIMGTGKWMYVN